MTGNANQLTDPVVNRPVPTLAPRSKPPITGGGATQAGKVFKVHVSGSLGLPAGVPSATACQGTVTLSVRKGKKSLVSKDTKLKSSCKYGKTLKVPASKVGKAKKLSLTVAFEGNTAVAPVASVYKIKVKRSARA